MTLLEVLTLGTCIGSGVFFAGVLVRGTDGVRALGWAALGAVVASIAVTAMRAIVPPRVDPKGTDGSEDEDEEEGGWDVGSAVLAAIVVPVFFVLSLLVRQWPLVLVVAAMCVGATDVSGWNVAAALASSLMVLLVLEVGVVWPLASRWGLPLD